MKKLLGNIRFCIRDLFFNRKNRKRLHNHDFSIISSDCTGGCVCKDLKVQMKSPTRNFYFNADDYIKFCSDLRYYLTLSLSEDTSDGEKTYLTAMLGDLRLFLVHYDSFEQAQIAWERRKKRVNFDNLYFVMNDRNYCEEKHIEAFDQLPYKNKVCFTHKRYPRYKSTYYLTGSEHDECVKSVMNYVHKWWYKRYYDQFDFVKWFNQNIDAQ